MTATKVAPLSEIINRHVVFETKKTRIVLVVSSKTGSTVYYEMLDGHWWRPANPEERLYLTDMFFRKLIDQNAAIAPGFWLERGSWGRLYLKWPGVDSLGCHTVLRQDLRDVDFGRRNNAVIEFAQYVIESSL